ncbi:MAG: hypothetical protein H6Q15_2140 [Bacteroidetes bacterium]|nr:hypothetical protein [Bacteroidota bacterium]
MKIYTSIISSLLFFCSFTTIKAESNDPFKIPEYTIPSPEVASFIKYGDIPVSEYSGTPNISIPIYTVKSGSLSLPIELSYGASGIQVSQEATWVGLGWNLIAGGCITYLPVGGNDQSNVPSLLVSERKELIDYINTCSNIYTPNGKNIFHQGYNDDPSLGWDANCSFSGGDYKVNYASLTAGLNGLGQVDLYSASFLGYSFKFYIDPLTSQPVIIGKKNKCRIEKNGNNAFFVTGEDGTIYIFSKVEFDIEKQYRNAWNLTQIIDLNGGIIKLNYQEYGFISNLPTLSEKCGYNFPDNMPDNQSVRKLSPSCKTTSIYLSSIETPYETVFFDVDDNRVDVQNARKLLQIRFVSKYTNQEIKKYKFDYDYFIGSSTIGGDYTADDNFNTYPYSDDLKRKRLKLKKITRYDIYSAKGEEYAFDYNDAVQLPLKTSFSRDYWGYYNGRENWGALMPNNAQHTLIPNLLDLTLSYKGYLNIPSKFLSKKAANRGASASYITAGMLKTVHYPTGGKSEFIFEPHTFENLKYASADEYYSFFNRKCYEIYCYKQPHGNVPSVPFTLNSKTYVTFKGSIDGRGCPSLISSSIQMKDVGISIVGPIGQSYVPSRNYNITSADSVITKSWNESFYLEPGKYYFTSGIPSSMQDTTAPSCVGLRIVSATLEYTEFNDSAYLNIKSLGGGIRIKKIINYDANNTVVNQKQYSYYGGKLLVPLKYLQKDQYRYGQKVETPGSHDIIIPEDRQTYLLSSDSYNPLASSVCGNNVGYDRVEIKNIGNGNANGTTIKYFENKAAEELVTDNAIFAPNYTNGDLLSQTLLNAKGDTVQIIKNEYAVDQPQMNVINYIAKDTYIGDNNCEFHSTLSRPRFIIYTYPNFSLWSHQTKQTQTDYLNGSKVTKTTEFSYNPNNYCINEQKETNSDKKTYYTKFTYPVDYTETPYAAMRSHNILNPVVEKSEYNGTTLKKAVKNIYAYFGSSVLGYPIFKPSIMQAKIGTNAYESRIYFNDYDNMGNPLYLTNGDTEKVVYIWGYNKQYPIAKIEGLSYTDIISAMGETLINTLADKLVPTSTEIEQIRSLAETYASSNNKLAFITTYTYKPLVGILTTTTPNGTTTYYEYDTSNRLKRTYIIENGTEKTIQSYNYHYQGQ